jgi:hypothetical protein
MSTRELPGQSTGMIHVHENQGRKGKKNTKKWWMEALTFLPAILATFLHSPALERTI